jgi:serine/threonine protein kinase/tetratricopeptide (TPR) repeat protein
MSEKYEILESIDNTPLGDLSRAYNPDSEKEVLFLQIYNHIRDDKKAIEDVWRQMNVYNELKHPVLPTVLDAIKSRGVIVTEFPASENIAFFIKKSPISQNSARKILRTILEALVAFESASYIHGNISPETIYFDVNNSETSNIVLSFSLGPFVLGELLLSNRKSKYLAPEMINDSFGTITPKSDLFCLGFSLLEALTGNTFDSHFQLLGHDQNTLWHVWLGDESKKLPEPNELVPNLDSDLETVLSAMLQRNTGDRLDAASLLAMLKNDEPSKPDSKQSRIIENTQQAEKETKKKKITFSQQSVSTPLYSETSSADKKTKTPPPKTTPKETQRKKEKKEIDISLSRLLTYIGIVFALVITATIIFNLIPAKLSFEELIKLAKEKIESQKFDEALGHLEKAKTLEPKENEQRSKLNFLFVDVYRNIATEKITEKKYDEALAELKKALELPPIDQSQKTEIKKLFIQIYLITAKEKIAEKKYVDAQTDLDLATKMEPDDEKQKTELNYLSVQIPLSIAEEKVAKKQYREAITDLDKAEKLEPIDEKQKLKLNNLFVQCYLELAEYQIAQKEFKEALNSLNEIQKRKPTDAKQKTKLAELFTRLYNDNIKDKITKKQYAEAQTELESLKDTEIFSDNNKAELFYQLAQSCAADKLFPESAKALDRAIDISISYAFKPLPKNDAILKKVVYRTYKPDAAQNTIQWQEPADWKTLEDIKEPFEISAADDFTDDDIIGLYKLLQLQSLNLLVCNTITNTGLKRLKPFYHIQSLEISSNKIEDEGLKFIGNLSKIERLSLIGCNQITDAGIKELKKISALKRLNIAGCNMTDAVISTLNTFSPLETLSLLGNNNITAEAILKLNALKNLRILNVDKCTNIKEDTIKKLREMYPTAVILPRENKIDNPNNKLP